MIAYLQLPINQTLNGRTSIFNALQGVAQWEIDSPRSAYFSLDSWMTVTAVRHLYVALRGTFGAYIRFGAATQKTTARAAALYKASPHVTIVTPEKTEAFLAELPITLLPGLGQRTAKYLKRHGITTFAAFRNVPGRTLKEWFGVSGLILQQFAQGIDPRLVEDRRPTLFSTALASAS